MNVQQATNLSIPEGEVKAIHNSNNQLLWGRVNYDTKYAGDTLQNGVPTPDSPVAVQTSKESQIILITSGSSTQNFTVELAGKNLFDKDNANILNTALSDSGLGNNAPSTYRSVYIRCQPNTTYTVSKTFDATRNRFTIGYTKTTPTYNMSDVFGVVGGNDKSALTITTGSDAEYLVAYVWIANGTETATDMVNSIQIEKNDHATPYTPYYNYELAKIGNYQDYIYKSGDDWYVYKETGKAAFNGSENWLYVDSRTLTDRFLVSISGMGLASSQNGFCNNNKFVNAGVSSDVQVVGISGSSLYFRINKDIIGSTLAADFKNWVSNNNIIIYTVLSTPTDTKITDSTLISQLNAVHQWLVRYGYNATVSGNLPLIINQTNLT